MICYKDKTFCIAKCAVVKCSRKATDELFKEANAFGMGVAVSDFSEVCDEYKAEQLP